jgi:hypothetical protein
VFRLRAAASESAAEAVEDAAGTATAAGNGKGRGQPQLPEDFLEIAEITNTHGVRGEVRVRPMTDFPEERFEKVRAAVVPMPPPQAQLNCFPRPNRAPTVATTTVAAEGGGASGAGAARQAVHSG